MITQEAYKPSSSYKGTATHTEQLLLKTAGKAFDKTQHPLIIKTLRVLNIDVKFLNMIKGIYENSTINIIHNNERLKIS